MKDGESFLLDPFLNRGLLAVDVSHSVLLVNFHLKSIPDAGSWARLTYHNLLPAYATTVELKSGDFIPTIHPLPDRNHSLVYCDIPFNLPDDEEEQHLHDQGVSQILMTLAGHR